MVAIPATPSHASLCHHEPAKTNNEKNTQRATRDLYRFIHALSGACKRDSNVLRDGHLVDKLELQAKEIIRARRQNRSSSIASSLSMSSSSTATSQRLSTSPLLSAIAPPSKVSKRRKLPGDYSNGKMEYGYDKSPLLSSSPPDSYSSKLDTEDKASIYMARGDGSSSLIPSVKISQLQSPYNHSVIANSVMSNDVMHMEHLSLDKPTSLPSSSTRAPRQSLDLGASMASTVSSASMRQYDLSDAEDAMPSSLTPTARYASAMSTYDYEDYTPARGIARRSVSYVEECQTSPSTDLGESPAEGGLDSRYRKDSCYSERSTSSSYDRVMPKKLRFDMDALSLYEKEDSMMDNLHMSTSSYKSVESSLVETLQSQVDLLLTENIKALAENARLTEMTLMSSCEVEGQTVEKQRVTLQVKEQSEQLSEVQRKLRETEQRADAQEDIRREAEVAFQAELDSKEKVVAALQSQMQSKDDEIGRLTKRVEDISGLFGSKMRERQKIPTDDSVNASSSLDEPESEEPEMVRSMRESNLFMDMELQKMRSTLLEKDREICKLYMHLSTKKKLIEEITKKFVQHMEEVAAAAKANNATKEETEVTSPSFATDGVRFDLDMFLFKNVVDKQRRMEELTAALGVMDREVEGLESRVAEKERENKQLRENQDFLTRSLQTVNAQVCRIQADNERLDISNQDKQARITTLMATLEDKDRQILHLDEQGELRQTQIDHLMSEADKSGRRSLKSTLFKGRASFSSSTGKSGESRGRLASWSSGRDTEDTDRSSILSTATPPSKRFSSAHKPSLGFASSVGVRGSSDFTDDRRSNVVHSQRSSTTSLFSQVFNDISSPLDEDDDDDASGLFGLDAKVMKGELSEPRSTCASYCASEVNDDEELYNELFPRV